MKNIVSYVQCTSFVRLELVNVAIFERAFGKGQLFGAVINEQRAFDELATVKSRQNCLATKIENLGLKARAPYDPLFRWATKAHFSTVSHSERSGHDPSGSRRRAI